MRRGIAVRSTGVLRKAHVSRITNMRRSVTLNEVKDLVEA
jgi:hypothetical protein